MSYRVGVIPNPGGDLFMIPTPGGGASAPAAAASPEGAALPLPGVPPIVIPGPRPRGVPSLALSEVTVTRRFTPHYEVQGIGAAPRDSGGPPGGRDPLGGFPGGDSTSTVAPPPPADVELARRVGRRHRKVDAVPAGPGLSKGGGGGKRKQRIRELEDELRRQQEAQNAEQAAAGGAGGGAAGLLAALPPELRRAAPYVLGGLVVFLLVRR